MEKLTGIRGPMFSEKTTELIGLCYRAEHAEKKAQAFKSTVDTRGDPNKLKSHNEFEYPATSVDSAREILDKLGDGVNFVAIDEIQFFDDEIVDVVKILLRRNIEVVFNGLPTDFRNEPFGQMPVLLCLANKIVDKVAVCTNKDGDAPQCNADATKTQRKINGKPASYNEPVVVIGASESYEARCHGHHVVLDAPDIS